MQEWRQSAWGAGVVDRVVVIFDVRSSEILASPVGILPSHTRICWPCKDSVLFFGVNI